MKTKYEINLSEGSILPKLIRYAIPVILSGVLQLAFNAADLIVVGRFAGETALAAVGSNAALITLLVNVLLGICTGTSVIAARFYGAADENNLRNTVSTSMIIGVSGGIIFGVLGIALAEPLLTLMGTPDEVLPLAAVYLRIYFAGLPVLELYNFASAVLRAVGDTRRPLYYLLAAGVINVALNLFFVIIVKIDVAGVALATVISQCVSAFLVVLTLCRSKGIYRLDIKHLRFSKIAFSQIMKIGLPAGIQSSMFSISNVLIQSSINSFGAVVMAGNSAAMSIESFAFTANDGINQASIAGCSQNMGARQYGRIKKVVLYCLLMEFVVSIVMLGLINLFSKPLLSIYVTDEEAIQTGCVRFLVMGAVYFANGMQHMMGGVVRSHGYSIMPAIVAFLGICGFRIFWIFTVFAAHRTLTVLYMSYPVSWILTFAAQTACYLIFRKKAYAKNELRMESQ